MKIDFKLAIVKLVVEDITKNSLNTTEKTHE